MTKALQFLFLTFSLVFAAHFAQAQAIVKGSGVLYTNGAPTHTPNLATDSELAIDTTSGFWYERSRDGLGWLLAGFRIQETGTSGAPTAAPADKQSYLVINNGDSLYHYRAATWHHLNNGTTYTGGTGINITGTVITNTGDLSATNEGVLGVGAGSGTTSTILSTTSGATGVTVAAGTGLSISESTSANGGTITLTNSSPDQTVTITNGGGIGVSGSYPSFTLTATDQSTTNEVLTISDGTNSEALGGQTLTVAGAGINVAAYNTGTNTLTITGTEIDGTVSNEGSLTVGAGSGTTSLIQSNTSGSTAVTVSASTGISISESSNTITLTNSAPDQTVSITNGGGIAVSGTYPAFTLTATDQSTTNEVLTISDGTNTEALGGQTLIVAGAGINAAVYNTGTNTLTITGTEVDGSTTNEIQTYGHSGTTTYTNTLSIGGGSWSITGGGIAVISQTGGAITVTATEVDGSTTNEALTVTDGVNSEALGGQTLTVAGAGINAATYSPGSNTLTITGTEVDGSVSNEGSLTVSAGGGNDSQINSNTSGSTGVTIAGGTNVTVTESGSTITISATPGAGVTDLAFTGTSSPVTLNSSTGTDVTFTAGGINAMSASGTNITITATEVDGSVSNELQTYSHGGTTTYTNTLSNGGGSWSITGAGIAVISQTAGAVTVTATEADGLTTNEGSLTVGAGSGTTSIINSNTSGSTGVTITASTGLSIGESGNVITLTNSAPDQTVTITNGGGVAVSGTYPSFTLTATDQSTTNEALTISDGTNSEALGGQTLTVTAAGINVAAYNVGTNTLTITGTEIDGSITNELQTIANTSDATSHTVTLSNSGGTVQLVEGSGITLTTTGTSGAGVVTISATGGSSNYQTWRDDGAGATPQPNANFVSNSDIAFTLTNDAGNTETEVTADIPANAVNYAEIQQVAASRLLGNPTVSAADVSEISLGAGLSFSGTTIVATDASATNEIQTYGHAGTTTYTNTLSGSGGSWSITGAGIAAISQTGGAITVTATEVDGSVSNELQTYGHSGTTSYTNTLSNSGGSFTLQASGIVTVSNSSGTVTIGAAEVDGSVSNELQTYSHSGTTTYTNTLSNGGGSWSITGAGIAAISQTGGAITVTATEVDGSITNELQTVANTSDATTHTVTLSNSGGSFQLAEGAGVTLTTTGTGSAGIVTIAATGDASDTNEGVLGVSAGSSTTSVITSNTSGATGVTVTAGTSLEISESTSSNGGTITLGVANNGITNAQILNGTITSGDIRDTTIVAADLKTTGVVAGNYPDTGNAWPTFTVNSKGQITAAGSAPIPDASASNEGSLTVVAGGSNDSQIHSNTTGSTDVVIAGGTGITVTESGSTITIASSATGTTDLAFTGTSSPVTLNSSTGTDVTFTAGGINSFSASGTNITITATEVDGSVSNELQTYSHGGTSTYTNTLSNGGGSWSITGAGIAAISQTAGAVTVTATEVDGSISNEGSLTVGAGSGTTSLIQSNTSGSTAVTLSAGTGVSLSESGNTITISASGGSGPDSTWIKRNGTYANRRITDNIYRTGTVGIRTTDTLATLNLREKMTPASNFQGALSVQGVSNGDSVDVFVRMKSSDRDSTEDFVIGAINSGVISGAGKNTSWYFGHNILPGGTRIDSTRAGMYMFWEDNFINGLPLVGNVPSSEMHWAFTPKSNSSNSGARVLSFAMDHLGRTNDLSMHADKFTLNRFGSAFGFRPGEVGQWLQADFYNKTWTYNDSLSIRFAKNGKSAGGLYQRNAANSTYISLIHADASDRVMLGSENESNVAAYNSLQITNGGNLWNEGGYISVGKAGLENGLLADGIIRSGQPGENGKIIAYNDDASTSYGSGANQDNFQAINSNSTANNWSGLSSYSSAGLIDAAIGFRHLTHASGYGQVSLFARNAANGFAQVADFSPTLSRFYYPVQLRNTTFESGYATTFNHAATFNAGLIVNTVAPTINTTLTLGSSSVGSELLIYNDYSPTSAAGSAAYSALRMTNRNSTTNNWTAIQWDASGGSIAADIAAQYTNHGSNYADIAFHTRSTGGLDEVMRITGGTSGRRVGVNTSTPAESMHVVGNIRADGTITTRGTGTVAVVKLINTTAVTGKQWDVVSDDDGDFFVSNSGLGVSLSISGTTGDVNIADKLTLSTLGTTATGLLGINAANEVSSVGISGGSFSGGTFTVDPTNLTFSGASSPVTLASSTGTDVTFVAGTNVTLSQSGNALTINATGGGGSGDIINGGNTTGAAVTIGTNDANALNFEVNNVTGVTLGTDYSVTTTAAVAATNTVTDRLVIATNSTGAAANSFGGGILWRGESSTTNDRDMMQLQSYWTTATDGSRTAGGRFRMAISGTMTDIATITNGSMTFSPASYVISGGSTALTIGNTGALVTLASTSNSAGAITLTSSSESTTSGARIGGTSYTSTTLAKSDLLFNNNYAASSGSGTLAAIDINNTINMTSTATGIQRGVYIRPTLTSLVSTGEYRAVEITANNSRAKGIYQTGANTFNNLVGKTAFGTTSQPSAKVTIAASSGGANDGQLQFIGGTLLSSPENGVIEYDNFRYYSTNSSSMRQTFSGTLFTQSAAQTIANTTTETTAFGTGVGTTTIPSAVLIVGKTVRIRGGGVYSTIVTPGTLTMRVKIGGQTVATATTTALAVSASNREFTFECDITCRTTGGSGTVALNGDFYYYSAAGARTFEPLNNGGAAATIATNASNPVDVTLQWDTANASKTVTVNVATVEILN